MDANDEKNWVVVANGEKKSVAVALSARREVEFSLMVMIGKFPTFHYGSSPVERNVL